jgi:hypothetical protein
VFDAAVEIDDVDVWLLLGDERRFDIRGDWETLAIERGGITLRLATVGTGERGNSGIDDVEFVIDDAGCVRVGIDGGITLVFVIRLPPFFDEDGVGMIVGRRIPPPVDIDTGGFSGLDGGGDGLVIGRGAWKTVEGSWRVLDEGLESASVTSPSGDEISKC